MRFATALAAFLMLGGCDVAPVSTAPPKATDAAPPDSAFDYRYAFRLPPSRIEAVQESHARGCDQLGPARCRITAMRYSVGADNSIAAVLTLKLDPTLARAFGKAAAQTVASAHGTMTDADIAGAESASASARGETVIARLQKALANAESDIRGATTPDQMTQAAARVERLRSAIATIGDVDQGAGSGAATAPVLFTYGSGGAIPGAGASPEANFATAGDTFVASLAGLLVVLAGIGPWVVLLLGGALLLRWILARTESRAAPVLPPAPLHDDPHRNVIQRWFNRDEAKEHEPVE